MKAILISVIALAIAASVVTYRAAAKSCANFKCAITEPEPCVGLECWPRDLPMKHRPTRTSLPPVW